MKFKKLYVSSSRFILGALFVLASAVGALGQKEKKVLIQDGSTIQIRILTEIPEATEQCTPAECEWWNQIRKANADLNLGYKNQNNKSVLKARERFFLLVSEGHEKSYRVPLKDRPPQKLVVARTNYPHLAKKNRIQGDVELAIEIGDYGTVENIQVIKGLGWGLTESAIQAARQELFLPAIKDGAFVNHRTQVKFGFQLGCAGCSSW